MKLLVPLLLPVSPLRLLQRGSIYFQTEISFREFVQICTSRLFCRDDKMVNLFASVVPIKHWMYHSFDFMLWLCYFTCVYYHFISIEALEFSWQSSTHTHTQNTKQTAGTNSQSNISSFFYRLWQIPTYFWKNVLQWSLLKCDIFKVNCKTHK